MSDSHGKVLWNELMTRDLAGAKKYYESICGWKVAANDMPGGMVYHVAMRGEEMMAGIMDMNGMPGMDDAPAHWFTYIGVDDVDAAVADTKSGGGTVMREPFDIEGVGRIAMIADPTGAAVGLMTPADMG